MKYDAYGYAVNVKEIFTFFKSEKLGVSRTDTKKLFNVASRKAAAARIFGEYFHEIVQYIVETDSRIIFQMQGQFRMELYIDMSSQDFFKEVRKTNKRWREIDFLVTDFRGFRFMAVLVDSKTGHEYKYSCLISSKVENRIIERLNGGVKYCGHKNVDSLFLVKDFIERKYPFMGERSLKYIIRYGYSMARSFMVKKCHIAISSGSDSNLFRIGTIKKDSNFVNNYIIKTIIKLREAEFFKWIYIDKLSSDYYYFTVNRKEHFEIINNNKKYTFKESKSIFYIKYSALVKRDDDCKYFYRVKIDDLDNSFRELTGFKFRRSIEKENVDVEFLDYVEKDFKSLEKYKNIVDEGFMSK